MRRKLSFEQVTLDEGSGKVIAIALAALIACGAYFSGPVMKKKLAASPIYGKVDGAGVDVNVVSNPQALPAAIGLPPGSVKDASDVDLEDLNEIFYPSAPVAVVDPSMTAKAKAQEAIRRAIAQLRVDAVSRTGAFIMGRYYGFGDKLGIRIPDGEAGYVDLVLAGASNGKALIRGGADVEQWIGNIK
ncbi:hypothetical protein [Geopseudomonas aromaticivorans]